MDTPPPENSLEPIQTVQFLMTILAPNAVAEIEKVKSGQSELVHYTTAENAVNIIRSERFWLRSVRCMNDYSEVQHGIGLLVSVFGGPENPTRNRLYDLLDKISPGEAKMAVDTFDTWIPRLPDITFIGCLSQADVTETLGRLSMWRAYSAPSTGVALVMDTTPFLAETDELHAYTLPVAYLTDDEFRERIETCLNTLDHVVTSLPKLPENFIQQTVFWWLLSMAVSLKHPAFHEEREWRIVYFPEMARSPIIEERVESINSVPQVIQKIPLIDDPANGLHGANPANLLKRIIIGPTEFPLVVQDAFVALLKERGVEDAADRITLSLIPLR